MMLMVLFSFSLLSGCFWSKDKDSDGDGVLDKDDKCKDVKGPKPDGCPIPPKIGKVNLYLETSASMGGYYGGSAAFKRIVSDLAVKVDKEISPVKIHFISDTITDYKHNATQFSSDIATTRIAQARSSELHHIFAEVAQATKGNDISILVSDCILSFPNAEVKANPEVNRQAASGTLKNNIYSTFVDLKKTGQAASLYAFNSGFFGTYYDYQNVKTKLSGTERPFYVWVIAGNKILPLFDEKLGKVPGFLPEEQLHFGLMDQQVKSYQILTKLGMQGAFKLINKGDTSGDLGIEQVKVKSDQPIQFSAVVNLSSLPPYARKLSYLQENLKIETKGCAAVVEITERPLGQDLKNKKQNDYYEQATHILKVNVKGLRLDKASVQLSVPLKYDSWYKAWSTMNDKDVLKLGKKTFALEHLVEGVMEAYNNTGKNFIDLKFQINQ